MTIHDMEFGRRNVGVWGTAFNIFKCFIGIGLLALPSAFHHVRVEINISLDRNSWRFSWHSFNRSHQLLYNDDVSEV